MSALICPKCEESGLKWITDIDADDLLENGIMECKSCKAQFVGIDGWDKERQELKKLKS